MRETSQEGARLRDLYLLDREAISRSQTVSRIVRSAAAAFGAPVAALSLVDVDQELFFGALGTDASCGDRSQAFCNRTIESDDVLLVPNSAADPRFSGLAPTREGGVRFYAGAPVYGPNGCRVGALCVRDTVPRKEAEELASCGRLRDLASVMSSLLADHAHVHRRTLMQATIERSAEPIYWLDEAGRLLYANASASRQLGYTADELAAKTVCDFDTGMTPEAWAEHWAELRDRGSLTVESEHRRADGTTFPVEVRANIVEIDGLTLNCAFAYDVTERRRMIEQLEAARVRADEANRTKAAFLANMSHEIRTPMTAILGFTELLGDAATGEMDRLDYVRTIQRNGEHLLTLINDILDLSKIEEGRVELERVWTRPGDEIAAVAQLLRQRAEAKGVSLRFEDETGGDLIVETDPTRLRQIGLNLIGNAVKFTARGSVDVRLSVVRAGAGERGVLTLRVTDTGAGMDEAAMSRLFQPFMQADASTSRRFGGTGLGLAVSQRLAELLGGRIEAESEADVGSTFTLTVDARLRAAQEREGGRARAMGVGEMGVVAESVRPLLGRRVLLAEDGVDNQRLISHHLRKAGAAVETVCDGRAAVDRVLGERSAAAGGKDVSSRDASFDVILMDMQMPELDGYDATRALREAGVRTPVLALTAHAMAGDRERCLEAGCDEYASKPIDSGALIATCARLIGTAGSDAADNGAARRKAANAA